MGITYRQGNDGRLSVQQMDDNFHYLEDQLAGLTSSNSGTSGTSGTSGITGATGTSGTSGTSGINGATGPTGPAGFGTTGAISFPFLPGNQRTGSGDNLQFEKGSVYQKIISTQDGTESAPTVERLVICGGDSYQNGPTYSGEGGDVYLYGGKGQDGGDIKVDAGEGISSGGTVKVRGGDTSVGNGGFVEISAGQSSDGTGGDVQVTAGNGYGSGMTGIGGDVLITSGYGSNTAGNITLNARDGGGTAGNVIVQTDSVERMRITADGKIGIGTASPSVALDVVGDFNLNGNFFSYGNSFIYSPPPYNNGLIYVDNGGTVAIGDANGSINGNNLTIFDDTNRAFFANNTNQIKVGINKTSPSVALDVVGDVNITGVITSTSSMILKPDSSLETDQYIILDPTEGGPNHIHIRAGGPIDDSSADLFIGGEDNNLKVSDTTKTVQINSKNLYTQDSTSFSVGTDYGSATWSGNLITITTNGTLAFGNVANFINGYQAATDIFTVFYDPTTAVSLNITNKDISNYPTHVLTVEQTAPTASLAITGIDIEIIRYQSGRVIADNGTVTIQAGDTVAPKNWVFGTTGSITFPDNSVQTTAYTPKYKVYSALITQSGTASPTAIIFENTIGDIVWSYSSVGNYIATLTGAFPIDQVLLFLNNTRTNSLSSLSWQNNDSLRLEVVLADSVPFQPSNSLITKETIEIRVYN